MLGTLYRTRGLIIKKRSFRETDKVIVVVSEDYGRIEILIRGARKTGNIYSGLLEPLVVADFCLQRGRIWDNVCDMILVQNYSLDFSKKDFVIYLGTSFILNVLNKLSTIDRDEKSFYLLTVNYLDGLRNNFNVLRNSDKMKMYLCSFMLSVLAVSGRLPAFWGCGVCSDDISKKGDDWNLSGQGLIHRDCLVKRETYESTISLTKLDKINLEKLLIQVGGQFILQDLTGAEVEKLYKICLFLLSSYLGSEIKSELFF